MRKSRGPIDYIYMREPLVAPALGCVLGAVIAAPLGFTWAETAALGLIPALLLFAARATWLRFTLAVCMGCALGIAAARIRQKLPTPAIDGGLDGLLIVEGCLVEPPVRRPDGTWQLLVELDREARARLYAKSAPPGLGYGQRIQADAELHEPSHFRNPGGFNYAEYLARRDIHWTGAVRGPIEILPGAACGTRFEAALHATRQHLLQRINRFFPGETYPGAMLRAFLLGDASQVQKIWTEHYRRTGTFHALVISGQHLSMIAGVLIALLRWILPGSRLGFLAGIAIAWIYAFLAGWTPPVIRAAAGLSLFLAGSIVYRRARVLNVLAAVTIAFLLVDPGQAWEASFQLSFLAVAAIGGLAVPVLDRWITPYLAAARHLNEPDRDLTLGPAVAECQVELRLLARTLALITRLPEPLMTSVAGSVWRGVLGSVSLLGVTLAIQAVLALPMVWYFHRVPVSGLVANLLIAIPVELALVTGFAALVFDWAFAARLSFGLLEFTGRIARSSAAWEPDLRIPAPPAWFAAALVVTLLLLAWSLRAARFRLLTTLAAAVGLFLLIVPPVAPPFAPVQRTGSLEFTAIDVGQGDGLLLSFPRGATMLVDGGGGAGSLNTGEDVIGPYLWSRRIRRVDVIVVTHAHRDHIGGVAALIDAFKPRELWTGLMHPANPEWQAVQAAARRGQVRIRQARAGDCFELDGARIRALAPFPGETPPPEPHNNDSLVLAVEYGRHRFLLAADAESEVEQRLLTPGFGRFDVLKAGHHGSRTSTTEPFLDAVDPAIVVISAGRRNQFRHPHPSVMARIEERKAQVLRTDRDGLVTVRSDGRYLEVDRMASRTGGKLPFWE